MEALLDSDNPLPMPDFYQGPGIGLFGDVAAVLKALEAQSGITDVAQLRDLGSLQIQSLENTLAMLTFREQHARLWKDVPKGRANSTLEEYSVQTGYGQEGGWVGQMETPLEGDPTAFHDFSKVKFLRQLWKASDVSKLVQTIQPSDSWSKQAAVMRMIRAMDQTLWFGDESMVPDEINGIEKTIRENGSVDHVIDQRGVVPTDDTFNKAAELIYANQGNAEGAGLYVSPGGQATLTSVIRATTGFDTRRIISAEPSGLANMALGAHVGRVITDFGNLDPRTDLFLASLYESHAEPRIQDPSNPRNSIEGATSVRAPLTPGIGTAAIAGPVAGSLWAGTGVRVAGDYRYKIYGVNKYGKSMASAATSAVTVAAGGAIDITIVPGASANPATAFVILGETAVGSGKYRFLARVAANGLTPVVYRDLNARIPGTTNMFVLDMTNVGEYRTLSVDLLAPIHAKSYATIGEYVWGSVNLYPTVKYYAPRRMVMITNVPVTRETKSTYIDL